MVGNVIKYGAIVLLSYTLLCVALFFFQRSLIYFPRSRAISDPKATLHFKVPDADLVVTMRDHEGPDAILYFGGNGEDVSMNLPSFSAKFPNHAIYLMHYRGYGGSTGNPTEEHLRGDAIALFDYVHKRHSKVVVIGRSLGSGLAISVASLRPAASLIMITPYDSILNIAADRFSIFPIGWLLLDRYESWRYAPDVKVSTLLIMAEFDEIIPASNTKKLLEAFAPGIANLKIIPGTSHNSISSSPAYLELIQSMI
jgi:uncharacterized protein